MLLLVLLIATAIGGPLIAAVAVVTIASHAEDARWSLDRPARGPVRAASRRLLAFHTELATWPAPDTKRPRVRPAVAAQAERELAWPPVGTEAPALEAAAS
jgi:hypothetical protein